MKNKKGYFLSIDAFIALIVILGIVLVVRPGIVQTPPQVNIQEDLLVVLSSIKIGELDNAYAKTLITDGKITNLNQSVLEQIGEFFAMSDPEATNLAEAIIDDIGTDRNIGIYFGGIPIAISSSIDIADATDIWVSRQIISGIQQGESAKGFSSRAFLLSSNKIDYFYFGGYIGDGNITIRIDGNVSNVEVEAEFNGPFDVYVNNQFTESHTPAPSIPYSFDLSNHASKFISGTNLIDFRSNQNKLAISGGFAKATIDETQALTATKKKYFSGIDGLINIYDSFFIPGSLNNMEVFLHYNSSENIFLTIGNKSVYSGNSAGLDSSVTIPDSTLSSLLDYSKLTQETIPLRLGISNASFNPNNTKLDVFSVLDLSSSMNAQIPSLGIKIIDLAKTANKEFIDVILDANANGNDVRIGLAGYNQQKTGSGSYYDDYLPEDYHNLSKNEVSLDAKVDAWSTKAGTCICCGILKATEALIIESNETRLQSMIIMSDGFANQQCDEINTGSANGDAIQAACDAFNNHNITVNALGFGDGVDETTLQAISSCGGGNYYFSEIDNLISIYKEIARDVINAAFVEQTIISEDIDSFLFPDSYVSIDFTKILPTGLVISSETLKFNNPQSEGIVNIPDDSTPFEVGVVSFSGSRWTDKVEVFNNNTNIWETIFNLSKYNLDFIEIGDPFIVNIPINKIKNGDNKIRVTTALSSQNSSPGSPENKIIYTIVKNITSFSPIVSSASGCIWTIEFEDSTNATVKVPMTYEGVKECFYTSSSIIYNNNDAIDISIFDLLSKLDLDSDGRVETKFSENDLELSSTEVEGIPFTWDTEVQVRVWR